MSESSRKKLDFIINVAFVLVVLGLGYVVFAYLLDYILPFLVAFLLVAALQPLINALNRRLRINQQAASVILVAAIYILAGGLILLLCSKLFVFARDGLIALPDYYQNTLNPLMLRLTARLEEILADLPLASWGIELDALQGSFIDAIQNLVLSISQHGISFISAQSNSIPSFLMKLMFTIMLSFFISLQYKSVVRFISHQIPEPVRMRIYEIRSILSDLAVKYLKAYLILMCLTFAELSIGLSVLKVPSAIRIAASIAVFDALPIFGTGGIMIPWVLIELLQTNYVFAFWLLILYCGITLVRNIVEPKIISDQLGLNPIVSLMSIYLGLRLFGVLGMILCPILAQMLVALHQRGSIKLYNEEPPDA